jgi:hypothetical protein
VSTWWQRFLALPNVYVETPEPEPVPVEPAKPRGVVVTRTVLNPEREFTQALDEYPDGDYWSLTLTADGKVAFLAVFDVEHRGIATYTPGSWDRIETGTADNIKTKVEEPNKP